MSDYTTVIFKGFNHPVSFNVASILAEFSIFGHEITIHWYGAIIAFGFALAVLFGGRKAYVWKMSIDKMIDVLIYGTVAGIIGARLYYVFSQWDYYGRNPGEIIKIWNGGLAIYGGLIGGVAAAVIVCKVRKMNFFNLLDLIAMSFLLAQGIGRWGNFTNQEAFGINTNMPWGMTSEKVQNYLLANQAELAARGMEVNPTGFVHPTFLYESIWCILGFIVLYIICQKARKFSGQLALCYGVWYGAERAVVEGLRTDSLYIANTNIRVSQLLSAVLALVCLVLLIALTVKYTKHPKPIDGIDFFLEEELKKQKTAAAGEAPVSETPPADETAEEDNSNQGEV